jgi:hypothetical protein
MMLFILLLALILVVLVVIAWTLARHRPALTPETRLLSLGALALVAVGVGVLWWYGWFER